MTLNYSISGPIVEVKLTPRTPVVLPLVVEWIQGYELRPLLIVEVVQEYTTPPVTVEFVQPYLTQGEIFLNIEQDYILIRGLKDEFYASFLSNRNSNYYDFKYRDVKVLLLDATYPIAQGIKMHQWLSDVQPYEVAGGGYTPGGKVVAVGDTDNYWNWWYEGQHEGAQVSNNAHALLTSIDPIEWTGANFNTIGAALYSDKASGEKPLIAFLDFGGVVEVAGTFELPIREDRVVVDVNPLVDTFYTDELWRSMVLNVSMLAGTTVSSIGMHLVSNTYVFNASDSTTEISPYYVDSISPVGFTTAIENGKHVIRFTDGTIIFPEVTGTFRYIFVRKSSQEVYLHDLGSDITMTGGDFVFQVPNGLFSVSVGVQ